MTGLPHFGLNFLADFFLGAYTTTGLPHFGEDFFWGRFIPEASDKEFSGDDFTASV